MQIPTDVTDLIALLTATPAGDRHEIAKGLAEQLGDSERAYRLFGEAEDVVCHEEEIAELRGELGVALGDALGSLHEARALIGRLTSDQVYDVEYAEGSAGDDLRHMVSEATRAIRIAQALQKQIGS